MSHQIFICIRIYVYKKQLLFIHINLKNIKMSVPYSKLSLNQLMQQLQSLGGSSQVKMQQNYLIAVLSNQIQTIRQYENQDNRNFLVLKNKKKKYYYNEVVPQLTKQHMSQILTPFYNGFNVNLLVVNMDIKKIINLLPKSDDLAFNHIGYGLGSHQNLLDLVSDKILNKYQNDFYKYQNEFEFSQPNETVTITRIIYPTKTSSELRILKVPQYLYSENNICKSQLVQIMEYLKKNKDRFGKQIINKLFIKKHKISSLFIDTIFDNSLNWIVNRVNQDENNLQFFNRFRGIQTFTKKVDKISNLKIHKLENKKKNIQNSNNNNKHLQSTSIEQKSINNNLSNKQNIIIQQGYNTHQTQLLEQQQFNYCRSLQRKTHKYSIQSQKLLQQQAQEVHQVNKQNNFLSNNQQIAILKSNHIKQISKYHQTIQALNSKLLIFQKQKGIQQICSVYQKQIMNLQFKIVELRKNIAQITKGDDKNLKNVIKKLNQQISKLQSQRKHEDKPNPKFKLYQNQIKQLNQKIKKSQSARAFLAEQLKDLSKRLQLRQMQISDLNKKNEKMLEFNDLFKKQTLSVKTEKQYSDLNLLLNELVSGNSITLPYIKQKISYLFTNLSDIKKLIIECHNFLLQLQNMMETKISPLDQVLVLDCNRFIRGFLMKSLQVQQ